MRKSLKRLALLPLMTLWISTGIVSCTNEEKPEPQKEPKIELEDTEITVSPDGGECSMLYTIVNPSDEAKLTVTSDQTWVHDLTLSDKAINFIVDANPDAAREANVTVKYTDNVSAVLKVKQLESETPPDEKIDMDFNFEYIIDGPDVTMNVEAVPGDVYFYFGSIDPTALEESGTSLDETVSQIISEAIEDGEKSGQSPEDVIRSICSLGSGSKNFSLKEKTTYTGFAVGVSLSGSIISDVAKEEFTTGFIPFLNMEILSVGLDKAVLKVTPINEKPYGLVLAKAADYEGMDDEAILESLLTDENVYIDKFVGEWQGTLRPLDSGTEYVVFGFGYEEGTATTDLYTVKFTTEKPGDPKDFTFTSEVTAGPRSATVTINGNPETVLYYFEVATPDQTEESLKKYLDDTIQPFIDLGILPDRISYFKEAGFRGTAQNTFTGLKSNTEYVVWAVSIDETTGDYVVFSFGEHFFTQS